MNRDIQKLKAILSVAFIYVPVLLFVLYFDFLFTVFVFDKFIITTWTIIISIFWLYIQALVVFIYYRCFIDIGKIFKNNKDFFLK